MIILVIRKLRQVMMAIFWHPTLLWLDWLNWFVEKSARSTKIHQFNIRAVDQISSVCNLFKVELNRIEKLDNPLLVWPIAKIQGMPKSEEEKNFKIGFKASPITEEIMAAYIFQCGCQLFLNFFKTFINICNIYKISCSITVAARSSESS